MSVTIHPTAIVSGKAELADGVSVGAYSIIEDDVVVGQNTEIRTHAVLANGSRIGNNCKIFSHAVIATEPQDLKFSGETTYAFVGDETVVREYATVNRGTSETGKTTVGKNCLLMAYTHVAHDCRIGDNVIFSNFSSFAGHVTVEDHVVFGGYTKIHQFSKIGAHAMIGADVKVVKDVPPYVLVGSMPGKIDMVNKIGLKRRGFSPEKIREIDGFYRAILWSGLNNKDGIAKYLSDNEPSDEIRHIIDFIESSERGIYR